MIEKQTLIDTANRVMRKLFNVQPGWYKELDIIKNNYALARSYIAQGNYKDAVFRLKFLLWIDPQHKAGWLDLAKSYIALDELPAATRAVNKLLALDAEHAEGKKLKAAMASGKVVIAQKLEIAPEMDAKIFHQIHKECFPIYWKEAEISDMLMTSGTQGWLARAGVPVGILLTRAQFEQAEILTIAVLPKSQKTGIASRLLDAAEKALAEASVKKIFLEVAENNVAAIGLYQTRGYKEMSRRAGYYRQADGGTIDALVMSKEL